MESLDDFYSRLIFHLLDSGIENDESIAGYSEEEIQAAEIQVEANFPKAYRLFEASFGKKANFHDFSEYQLTYLPDALEVMQEIAVEATIDFCRLFPFSQWQGYSVFCFDRNGNNPEVVLFVSGDDGVEQYIYSCFTDWLLEQVSAHLRYVKDKTSSSYRVHQLEKFIKDSKGTCISQ
jgi:hypothetical protein